MILLSLILIGILVSCATVSGSKINAPSWYFKPQSKANHSETAFVGVGQSANERQALLLAYTDINNRLFAYIGNEPTTESYRELSRSGKIASFDFEVVEKYQVLEDGQYMVYLLALGKNQTLNKYRSEAMLKESEMASEAERLILEGDELIKSNQDILGLKKYIESMVLSYPLTQIDDEYSFAFIMQEILEVLSSTSMTVVEENPSEASCTVSVKRKSSLIPSRVINAPIRASYQALDSRKFVYEDSFVYSTDNGGTIVFSPENHAIAKQGAVVFSFDFDKELRELARVSESAANTIKEAISDKAILFEYKVNYADIEIALSSFELSVDGNYIKSDLINSFFTERFSEEDIKSFVLESRPEDTDEEVLKAIKKTNPDCDYALISRVGYSDYSASRTGNIAVTSEGTVRFYDLKTGQLISDIRGIFSNGFGNTEEKALEDSYLNFASIIYSIIKALYV